MSQWALFGGKYLNENLKRKTEFAVFLQIKGRRLTRNFLLFENLFRDLNIGDQNKQNIQIWKIE